jgi:hypothetical protein
MPYRGANRLPFIPRPLTPGDGTVTWPEPWPAYFEADDSGELHRHRHVAEDLVEQFRGAGIDLEVAYLRLAFVPRIEDLPEAEALNKQWSKSLTWLEGLVGAVPPVPGDFRSLGYDLAMPIPSFTSKIFYGLPRWRPDIQPSLNEFGLLDSVERALDFLGDANAHHHAVPDCILSVFAGPEPGQLG